MLTLISFQPPASGATDGYVEPALQITPVRIGGVEGAMSEPNDASKWWGYISDQMMVEQQDAVNANLRSTSVARFLQVSVSSELMLGMTTTRRVCDNRSG